MYFVAGRMDSKHVIFRGVFHGEKICVFEDHSAEKFGIREDGTVGTIEYIMNEKEFSELRNMAPDKVPNKCSELNEK